MNRGWDAADAEDDAYRGHAVRTHTITESAKGFFDCFTTDDELKAYQGHMAAAELSHMAARKPGEQPEWSTEVQNRVAQEGYAQCGRAGCWSCIQVNMVGCDGGCGKWFHNRCCGLHTRKYNKRDIKSTQGGLSQLTLLGEQASFVCEECNDGPALVRIAEPVAD